MLGTWTSDVRPRQALRHRNAAWLAACLLSLRLLLGKAGTPWPPATEVPGLVAPNPPALAPPTTTRTTGGMTCNHCVDLEIPEGATCSFCLGGDGCTGACDHCPTEHATRIYAYADDVVACVLEHAAANPNQWRSGPQGPKTRLDVLQLAPRRVLAAWLEWQGILGYADRALAIMDAESEVLEPDEWPTTNRPAPSP